MRILFVTYWGINEGLAQATVWPHLDILLNMEKVEEIDLVSVERIEFRLFQKLGVNFYPFLSGNDLKSKLFDSLRFNVHLKSIYKGSGKPDLIIARGVMAGWLCMNFSEQFKVPLSVESFEPHSEYMLESGVWKKAGYKYRTLLRSENRQKKYAKFLLPVTSQYADYLVDKESVPSDKVMPMPCCVDPKLFAFNLENRKKIRANLNLEEDRTVVVYTGKFGGIYLQDEALNLIKRLKNVLGNRFFLLVLSPDKSIWKEKLEQSSFNIADYYIGLVSQEDVAAYLSASDIALSLHKPTPSKIAISPIKNAEYWSNGLPIIMPNGIGDDSEATKNSDLGMIINDFSSLDSQNFDEIIQLSKEDRLNNDRVRFAQTKRSFDIVRSCYNKILSELNP